MNFNVVKLYDVLKQNDKTGGSPVRNSESYSHADWCITASFFLKFRLPKVDFFFNEICCCTYFVIASFPGLNSEGWLLGVKNKYPWVENLVTLAVSLNICINSRYIVTLLKILH